MHLRVAHACAGGFLPPLCHQMRQARRMSRQSRLQLKLSTARMQTAPRQRRTRRARNSPVQGMPGSVAQLQAELQRARRQKLTWALTETRACLGAEKQSHNSGPKAGSRLYRERPPLWRSSRRSCSAFGASGTPWRAASSCCSGPGARQATAALRRRPRQQLPSFNPRWEPQVRMALQQAWPFQASDGPTEYCSTVPWRIHAQACTQVITQELPPGHPE